MYDNAFQLNAYCFTPPYSDVQIAYMSTLALSIRYLCVFARLCMCFYMKYIYMKSQWGISSIGIPMCVRLTLNDTTNNEFLIYMFDSVS